MRSALHTGPLADVVQRVWTSGEAQAPHRERRREHVMPTGMTHVVFRLSGAPLRLFGGPGDTVGETRALAVVGGARGAFYAREVPDAVASVGVLLRPGGARRLFGVPSDVLAGTHVDLVWDPEILAGWDPEILAG